MSSDSSRRLYSRHKVHDESLQISSNLKAERLTSRSPAVKMKPDNQENDVSIASQQKFAQHTLAASYINKEPFNEDIVPEEYHLVQDLHWRVSVIDKLKEKISEIKALQADKESKGYSSKLALAYRQGLLLCSSVKKLNRVANMRVNKVRNTTHEEKNKIDEHHLELQNLLYEISHLQVEINKCLEFRSCDEDINLVDLDTFYASAPIEISKPEVTKFEENVHKLKLARLDWELLERQNMLAKIKELEKHIEQHEQELKSKQNKLESLQPKLTSILDACKPTLEYFNTNFYDNYVFSEQVQYLPKPLYQFYMMMTSFRDTVDKELEIEVCGDVEEAKRFDTNATITFDDEDSDSNDEDGDYSEKKKKSKSKANKKKNNIRDKLFKTFPLSCKLTIPISGYGVLSLTFFYLNYLKIVAVKIETSFESTQTETPLLRPENMFSYLYPGDNGSESPNLSNKFLFNNTGVKSIEPFMKHIGIPYKWCQVLCGLYYGNKSEIKSTDTEKTFIGDYVSKQEANKLSQKVNGKSSAQMDEDMIEVENEDEKNESEESDDDEEIGDLDAFQLKNKNESKFIILILNRLKSRFKARVILQKTLNSTKNSGINSNSQRMRIQSSLVSCKESSFEKFSTSNYTQHLVNSNLCINETGCVFYEIILLNSAAKLQAQVAISQDYPKVAPLFAINIHWKHERNFTNDEAIRDMERELNVFRDNFLENRSISHGKKLRRSLSKISIEERNYDLFSKQINHLLVCFDVYLESESYYLQDNEYQRTKLFPQSVRGRDRKRPYSYMANKDLFVQRLQFNESTL